MVKTISFQRIYHPLRDYLLIILGTMLYAFGFNAFILALKVVPGGLTGICSILYYLTGIPVSMLYFVINGLLLLIALKLLGKKFVVNSICGVASMAFFLMVFEKLLGGNPLIENNAMMSILIGASLCGLGLGIIFAANGSTGGTDIVGAVINKYKNISIGRALLYCDFIIIASSWFLFHDFEKICYGYVATFIEMYVLDKVLNANTQSVQFFIFSQKYDEIVERILKDIGRGCTILDAEGGYSKKPMKVIVLLAKKRESVSIFRLIKSIDHQAFISQSNVRGVYGEGFDRIKA